MTELLLFLYRVYTEYFVLILAASGVCYYFRERLWSSARTLPGMRFINERMKVRRGMDFVSSYHVLQASGFNNPQTFKFLILRSKGLTHSLYLEASERLIEGRPLATVFDNPEWPALIHQNLQGFEKHNPNGRDVVLMNLSDALKAYYFSYSEKISNTASFIGFLLMLLSIAMLAIGFYMPIINFNSALKHMQ
jgi:type II secretory pathway component PulF